MTSITICISRQSPTIQICRAGNKMAAPCRVICQFFFFNLRQRKWRSFQFPFCATQSRWNSLCVQSWLRNLATLLNFGPRLERQLGITCSFVTAFRRNWHHSQGLRVLCSKSFGRNSIRPRVRPQTAAKGKTKEERRAFRFNLRLNQPSDFNRLKRKSVELIEGYRLAVISPSKRHKFASVAASNEQRHAQIAADSPTKKKRRRKQRNLF